jgi:hypothetical protein
MVAAPFILTVRRRVDRPVQITFAIGADNATLPLAAVHDPRQVAQHYVHANAAALENTHARSHEDLDLDRSHWISLSLSSSLYIVASYIHACAYTYTCVYMYACIDTYNHTSAMVLADVDVSFWYRY